MASCYLESWGGYQQSVSVPMVDDGGLLQKIGCGMCFLVVGLTEMCSLTFWWIRTLWIWVWMGFV